MDIFKKGLLYQPFYQNMRALKMDDKDEAISEVLEKLNGRPLFVNITYSANYNMHDRFLTTTSAGLDIEVVGSSKDGLKTARFYDVGDVDILVYSRIFFDAHDEATFEFRSDNPLFFHIPHPRQIQNTTLVDGKYLNARWVRLFVTSMFGVDEKQTFRRSTYSIMPKGVQTSDLKCATTETINFADQVFDPVYKAPDSFIDHHHVFVWNTEHIVFAYLLYTCNSEKVEFVREMLYGAEHLLEKGSGLRSTLKDRFGQLKQDFQKAFFGVHDLLYFKSDEFQNLLTQTVDEAVSDPSVSAEGGVKPHGEYSADKVPAIRCRAWPRTAKSFITRRRVWPPKEVVDEIVAEGFRIVPKSAILDPFPLKDFILSFSHADVRLVRLLPEEARVAYRLVKIFFKCGNVAMRTKTR
ncbi:uncharacterized protein LOC127837796 isoform X1 [Dreissena polymorpha]|nr:uncharacterized protein LOC127837796 isoform X1 [Dreissena polymorpha]